ncbi:phospho-N-acetylmuramoyl-pentapeptide-transferase [Johnsonella ignava]|uniref:phospho-N-acetylmuramoyl-pentapeptide- transferase n=1 Tax=Johnsonella ignava TaxID=43995 RepID=UPI0023F51380|nr:phospho-N-acetylmuramoyl-pentapeptide-transferase [Johnsonella ignava]
MINDSICALLISFIVCASLCPLFIPFLYRLKFGQQVREDGPQGHLKKSGTPTMGGIVIMLAVAVGAGIYSFRYREIFPVLAFTLGYGAIGFADDFLKIKKKQSEGLSVKGKLCLQLLITAIFAYYLYKNGIGSSVLIPFTGSMNTGIMFNLGILYIPAVFVIVLGTDNGVNFTDGLDGLCSSVTIAVAVFFTIAAIKENITLAPMSAAVAGSLLGFLIYNVYPAKIFMGDTGSLALGGYVSGMALVMKMPLFIIIVGFIYLVEVLSVIIQVGYFKKTGGKRFFKMAPIHHHFELSGWSEVRVAAVFTIITIILSLLTFLGINK